MNHKSTQGVAIIEFSLSMLVLVPLLLGVTGIGVQMVQSMDVIGVARDAARLYGASDGGKNFLRAENLVILSKLGASIGLHTNDANGTAVLILTAVKYDGTAGTANYQHWVFHQRLVIGNPNYRTSNFGSPLNIDDSRFPAVNLDSQGFVTPASDETNNPNARADFTAQGNPFLNAGLALTDLPPGTILYVSECAAQGFRLPPFASGGMMYSYNVF